MAITPRFSWEVADGPDAPNVPFALNELALDIEGTVGAIQDLWTRLGLSGYRIEAASKVVNTDAAKLAPITFVAAFASPPVVVLTHGSAGQVAASLSLNALPTATAMLVNGQWPTVGLAVRVNYVAIGPAVPVVTRAGGRVQPAEDHLITYHLDPGPEATPTQGGAP